jgi:hypothetical protein
MRSLLTGTAAMPSAECSTQTNTESEEIRGFLPGKPLALSTSTTAQSLLDLRVLSTVNHESEHSDCQNTCDNANQCCRIHLMYPPFFPISYNL